MDTLYYIILVPMVYVAVAVFVIGMFIRGIEIVKAPKQPTTLKIYSGKKTGWPTVLYDTFLFPTVLRHKPLLWIFLILFHLSLLLLFIGHLELFKTISLFRVIPHDAFIGGGWTGVISILCILYFLFRRFHAPVRELSVPEDYFLLILLLLTVLFGSQMNWARIWYDYGEFGVGEYQDYLLSLLTLKPAMPYDITASGHSIMMVLHVFFANLFLMVFPFSQLMHAVFSLPMNKLRRG